MNVNTSLTVTLPFDRETSGTVVFALKSADLAKVSVGQVYVRKHSLEELAKENGGRWPTSITLTVEPHFESKA